MKIRLYVLIAVSMSLLLSIPVLEAQEDGLQPGFALVKNNAPIRPEADRTTDILETLEPGTYVTVVEISDRWARVTYEVSEGWTFSSNLVNVNGPTPVPRGYHQMIYDIESDRMILHGGCLNARDCSLNDTWVYDQATNTWTEMEPSQSPPAGEGPLAYDSQSDRAILILGPIGWPFEATNSETWAYDLNTNTWTNTEVSSGPPPLLGARMVYDSESDRMILFGGLNAAALINDESVVFTNQTWTYDFDSNTWTNMEPDVSPPGMNYHAMAYDAGADQVILIGSRGAFERTEDTWLYDYNSNTWDMRTPDETPGLRDYSAMVYADNIGQLVLFGQGEPTILNDTWTYDVDSNVWTELEPESAPSERGWHAMAYNSVTEQIILFGGGPNRGHFTLETWVYDPVANTWIIVGP